MLPVRCFSCNKVIGQLDDVFNRYCEKNKNNINNNDGLIPFFEEFNIRKYCCRKIFLTHVDIYDYTAEFNHDNIVCKSASEVINIFKTD
jgi:DNA-directed RNA polymerase subunit N (RpoN/RPB10)